MSTKKIIVVVGSTVIIFIVGIIGYQYSNQLTKKTPQIHYHAGFIVYVRGERKDFSGSQYMKIEPCTTAGSERKEDDQLEKAHLHSGVGDVVHVHREGAVWKDLFTNIKFPVSNEPVTGYVNSIQTDRILDTPIRPYDSVVFAFGTVPDEATTAGISQEHIIAVERTKEQCGNGQ
jgi:hypothetical protein